MEPPILDTRPCLFQRKKDLSFDELVGPVKKMAISQHGPQNKLTKLYNYGHKISKRFTQTDHSSNKAHTLAIKLAIYSDICKLLSFSSTSLVLITVVSLANLHMRPEALARYYVTSDRVGYAGGNNRVTFPPWVQPFLVALYIQSSTF